MQSFFFQNKPVNFHSHNITISITFQKRKNQEFVQQSQGIKSLLKLNIDEANPPLMAYG
jgi:hypothetical protein